MSQKQLIVHMGALLAMLIVATGVQAKTKVGKYAYVSENGQLQSYTFDPTTGRLRSIQSLPYEGFAGDICVSPSNKFVYLPTSDTAAASPLYGFKVGKDGTLTTISGFPMTVSASAILFTPNGKFAYTVNFNTNTIGEYSVNTTSGVLTSTGSVTAGSSEVASIAITPKGKFAYVPNIGSNNIGAYSIDPTTGLLTPIAGSPFSSGNKFPESDVISPSGKFLFAYAFDGSTAVFSVNSTTGALTAVSGSPFPGLPNNGGDNAIDPTGHFYYTAPISSAGVAAYAVNQSTGALTEVPGSPFPAGSDPFGITADPSGNYLYVTDVASNEFPFYVFSIDSTSGALTPVLSEGLAGQLGGLVAFASGSAAVKYTPTFAYVTNSGTKSISELSIASGGLSSVGTVLDSNGPQSAVAMPAGTFLYTGNSDGSISEYSLPKTGKLKKLSGSPITGLMDPMGLAISPFYDVLYAEDPAAEETFDYNINTKTGALTLSFNGSTDGNGPDAIAVDPFGAFTLVVNNGSDQVAIGIPGSGFVGTTGTGLSPVAITIDPSNQFVYVANSGDGTVSGFDLTLASPYLTPISGSPYMAGTGPSALVAEPYGRYLYVANGGSNSISAYRIDPLTGVLSPISGTFSTTGVPSSLSVSNDAKYLYVTNKDVGQLQQFTINSDGTLTASGGAGVGTMPTSVTTIGTYK
jgi:6-phosphogluconolactonase (cycloisomerase 2 family)